jgi:NADH:ubiquinone reductase (H+-translocating)
MGDQSVSQTISESVSETTSQSVSQSVSVSEREPLRVIVIGAGFAGLSAAKRLSGHGVEVTIVDRDNFHTFQPLLYQVASAGLDVSDVAYPVRAIFKRRADISFRHGEVAQVDLAARHVVLRDGSTLEYDALVVATGATAGFFGITGAADNSHPLYTLANARKLRNLILRTLEDSEARPEHHDGGAPSLVVVGGGPTGVETAGALVELLAMARETDMVKLDWDRVRVILVDAADQLLGGFHPAAGEYALETLRNRGVDIRLSSPVKEVTHDGLRLGGDHQGEEIRADVVIWAGGVTVDGTLAASLPVTKGKGGRIQVGDDLTLAGHPEVCVVGDAALVPTGRRRRRGHHKAADQSAPTGPPEPCPQLAQVAIQSGKHAAEQILRRRDGLDTVAFTYHDKGEMATIGRRAAVAQLTHGPVIKGFLGWLAWLGLHLVYLIGFRNRLVVLINWTWRYFDWPSGPRLIIEES